MPPATPKQRLVRRAPLMERIKAYLNPLDFLLWLSEELNTNEWEESFQKTWAYPAGLILNVAFMIARANTTSTSAADADIFVDSSVSSASGWLAWLASTISWALTLLSFSNAFYTFYRRRHYRLFEASIDVAPNTPSAHRVRVDSSPFQATPLRFLRDTIFSSAESRAHPDPTRDVWELHVWDPTPLCLRLFCLFSPGHVLVYNLFLPLNPLDSRPSVTVATTLLLAFLISAQLLVLQGSFSQQIKDTAVVHKEVQNEYDTKFVKPIIYHPVRDVGTQVLPGQTPAKIHEVLVSTPKTYVNRGFKPNPNPNYAKHYDPDSYGTGERYSRSVSTPSLQTPLRGSQVDFSSPLKSTVEQGSQVPRSAIKQTPSRDGAYFGIQNHAQSPLRKSVAIQSTPQGSSALASGSHVGGRTSPQKRISTPGGLSATGTPATGGRVSHLRGDGIRRDSSRF